LDPTLLTKTHLALQYWIKLNPKPPQWWWKDIGLPQYAGVCDRFQSFFFPDPSLLLFAAMLRSVALDERVVTCVNPISGSVL
jgi:hypothetical protein